MITTIWLVLFGVLLLWSVVIWTRICVGGVRRFFYWIKWARAGKPYIKYSGYNCGLCGAWMNEEFEVAEYLSLGQWWDTWGICPNGCDWDEVARRNERDLC